MQYFGAAAFQCGVVGVLRQGCGLAVLPQVLRGFDLGIGADRQVVHALVELDGCGQRVFGQVCEVLGDLFASQAKGFFGLDGGGGKFLQAGPPYPARRGQHAECSGGLAHVFAKARTNGLGQGRQLAHAGPSGIARQHQRLAKLVGLFAALGISQGQHATRSRGHRERVDQAGHITAQRTGGIAHAPKHVFQLAALLQQDRERRLPALQAGDDVGELRGHAAHGSGGLLGAHAHFALRQLDSAQAVQVGLEHIGIHAALVGQLFKVFGCALLACLHGRSGALHAGNDAAGGLVQFLSARVCALANAVNALRRLGAKLAHRIGHALAGTLYPLEAFFGRSGVDADLKLRFSCVSHCCCSSGFVQGLRPRWRADRQRRHARLGRSGHPCPSP